MSRFTDLLPGVTAAIDDMFGDPLQFLPWKEGRYTAAGQADLSRPARTLMGTFSLEMDDMSSSGDDASMRGETVPVSTPLASFSLALFPGGPETWPREGDHIVRLTLPGAPVYQVAFCESDDVSRLYVHVVRL